MTIRSTFYDTSADTPASLVTEVKWAEAHPWIGSSNYGITSALGFKVTAHPSLPSTVNVAAGSAWGYGVFDVSDAIATVTCSAPAAGTSRWDLICIRRDWTPSAGGPSTVTKVEGGPQKVIPAGRMRDPGTLDDQPLALVQWTAGQTQPTKIVDLRCWAGNGGMTAVDDLALSYLDIPGATVSIQGSTWYHGIGLNGTTSWGKAFSTGKIPVFGMASALAGALGDTTDFLIQAGTTVNYYDQSSYARITWPKPFPNGLLTVLAMDGDDWSTGGSHTIASAGIPWGTEGFGNRISWVYTGRGQDLGDDGVGWAGYSRVFMAGRIHRINWLAIGF